MLVALWTAVRTRIAGWLAAIGLAAMLIGAAYTKGRQDAASRQTEHRLKSIQKARKVEDEINRLDGNAVDARLGRWMRDS